MEKMLLFLFKGLACLPFPILYCISDFIYFVIYHVVKYRTEVVRCNLSSAFPEKNIQELKRIEKSYYRFLADQIVETVKLFHFSDKALRKHVTVSNAEVVNATLSKGKNAVLLMGHYANWEWVQEITRYFIPEAYTISIYHPLRSKLWDRLFIRLRSRWNAHILPMKSAPKALLNKANFPWVCGFIADQRPNEKTPLNCIEFLNHPTYFIYGPEVIGEKVHADFFYLEIIRKKRGFYEINFHPLIPEDMSHAYPHIREFWKKFETTIINNPPYWLWSHKRWK